MVKKSAMCSFVLVLIAIGLTIAALSTYWYYERTGSEDSSHIVVYSKYDKVKISYKNSDGDTTGSAYGELPDDTDTKKIYQTSLAFTALAFIVLVVAEFLILLTAVGLLKKIPCFGGILTFLGKFILIAGTVFCFLAVFIFIGIKNSREDDCKDKGAFCNARGYDFVKREDNYMQSGYLGWSFMVIASAFTLVATVINIIGGFF